MTPDEFATFQQLANDAAEAKADAVLRAFVILHTRLVSGLIAKGAFSREEIADSIAKIQMDAVNARKEAPELFDALSTATMMLGQAFGTPAEGAPS